MNRKSPFQEVGHFFYVYPVLRNIFMLWCAAYLTKAIAPQLLTSGPLSPKPLSPWLAPFAVMQNRDII
jgi:hypothetical protein